MPQDNMLGLQTGEQQLVDGADDEIGEHRPLPSEKPLMRNDFHSTPRGAGVPARVDVRQTRTKPRELLVEIRLAMRE